VCCSHACLHNTIGFKQASNLIFACRETVNAMTRRERSEYNYQLISGCMTGVRQSGYGEFTWKVGTDASSQVVDVCRTCFSNCYGIPLTTMDRVVRSFKNGEAKPAPALSDRTVMSDAIFRGFKKAADYYGLKLTRQELAAARMPNSPVAVSCYAWMARYFSMVGDDMSNSEEIHLEPTLIKDVWAEYREEMISYGVKHLSVTAFGSLWTHCFSYVKIREFKAVSGKCDTCLKLSKLRRTFHDSRRREYITMMHAFHRCAYMNERIEYAKKRNLAESNPTNYLSIISDGMSQNHCLLPYFANQDSWNKYLPQHLQGYRTFHTVANSSSLQLHCFLLALEEVYKTENNRLPDTIFYQIDGGSENTAKCVLAMCELIVARRLTKKIILTRLPVGHTHEDIDSKFGTLWRFIRSKHVYTPQEYESHIVAALNRDKLPCTVEDIFVTPNYKKLLGPLIDHKLEGYVAI